MTQVPDSEAQKSVIVGAPELEATLSAAFSSDVPERIKRSLIAAMQIVVNEVDDE